MKNKIIIILGIFLMLISISLLTTKPKKDTIKLAVDPKKDVKLTDNNIKNVLETTSADNISYDSKELIKKASEHFKKAKEAQKNDDWASYGEEINALGKTLELLEKQ